MERTRKIRAGGGRPGTSAWNERRHAPAGDYPEFRGDVSAAVEQAIAKVGADAESFSITSDLDYMPFLEAGWSEQAPAGFIALTFREATEQLGQMAREA